MTHRLNHASRTDSREGVHAFTETPPSAGRQEGATPPSILRIRRSGLAHGDYLSFRGFPGVAHFLPFPPPTHPLLSPENAATEPPPISPLVSTSSVRPSTPDAVGREKTSRRRRLPLPSPPPIDVDRSCLPAGSPIVARAGAASVRFSLQSWLFFHVAWGRLGEPVGG
jgi:hypothetical protein